jgi:hypothetical protein
MQETSKAFPYFVQTQASRPKCKSGNSEIKTRKRKSEICKAECRQEPVINFQPLRGEKSYCKLYIKLVQALKVITEVLG